MSKKKIIIKINRQIGRQLDIYCLGTSAKVSEAKSSGLSMNLLI